MDYIVYGDESGTTGSDRCYSIGLLCVPAKSIDKFNDYMLEQKSKWGITGELKWSKIKNSAGQANMCLALLNMTLKSQCCFHSIIVEKSIYRNWRSDREKAFYQTYTSLVKAVARQTKSKLTIHIDQKCDKYKRNDEVIGIIANNMLSNMRSSGSVNSVKMEDSKLHLGLQAVDILTGAVNSGYMKFLNPSLRLSDAKETALPRMANMLGWDELVYDTYPNKSFNIWHFPEENRARPDTKSVNYNPKISKVSRDEM